MRLCEAESFHKAVTQPATSRLRGDEGFLRAETRLGVGHVGLVCEVVCLNGASRIQCV